MTQKWLNYEGIFLAELQVRLKKIEYGKKVFSCNLFPKVKLSNIFDSLHVK